LLLQSQRRAHEARVDYRGAYAPNRKDDTAQRSPWAQTRRTAMTLGTILLIVLILLLIGALPSWPYSSGWGYRPTGLIGVVLIIVIILLLLGRI
jgi:Na+/melibiose symporter-like transporter